VLPYWILFAVFALGALAHSGARPNAARSQLLLNFAAFFMALMIGLRYEVGGDWPSYEKMFALANYASYARMLRLGDPGYQTLSWLVAQLGAGIWLVNLICGSIFTWGLTRFAKAQAYPWLAMLVAIPYMVVVVAMGYTRQAVAMGIIMGGLAALKGGGSNLRFAIYVAVAALFHKTAIVVLPLVLLADRRNRFMNIIAGAAAFFFLYELFLSSSVDRYVRVYVDAQYASQGAGIRVAMSLIPAILFMLAPRKFAFAEREAGIWRYFSLASFGFVVLLLVLPSSTAVDRLALYILPLQIAVLARVPVKLLSPVSGTVMVILYSFAVLFVWLNFAVHAFAWLPYQLYPW
jgi:hypothetical protein